ncbi:MAG TPA: ABC transporter permease [Bacilli bacterium]
MRLFSIRLKVLLRSKANIFWTFFYPLLLGLFFYMGFGNLSSRSSLDTVPAYIASDKGDLYLKEAMVNAEYRDGKKLFQVNAERTKEELETALREEKLSGYIYSENGKIYFRIRKNGIQETITKIFLDEYLQAQSFYLEIQTLDPAVKEQVLEDFQKNNQYLEEISSGTNPDYNAFTIYFYALIAMTCMFGSFWGVGLANDLQADNSYHALRTAITPASKLKLIFIYFLAALAVQFSGNLVLIFYLKYILKVEFAHNLFLIILTTFLGTLAGIAMGTFLSGIIQGSEGKKDGIMVTVSLLASALSGLMIVDVKYWVETYLPPLKFINPAGLVTDSFYSLYYFSDLKRYFTDIICLFVLSVLLVFGTYLKMRRTRYDSV